ncbi:MAG: type VI secretion system baseplate subunit TssG [Bryobacteraceae bacterium]|nr:type VI secretion system baseplate subunit TssG [Bryobacteraceae bacterium]
MATASGIPDSGITPSEGPDLSRVIKELQKDPGEFDFFQAVRLLQLASPDQTMVGTFGRPETEAVRFRVNPDLAFPPAELKSLEWKQQQAALTLNFMGLTGPAGVLPYCYSELVQERLRAKDDTLAAFYDLFNHRIISLFYQAWERYRFGVVFEREGHDRLSSYLLALLGLGTPGLQDRQDITDRSLLFYAGLLSMQPRSALALESLIGDYFGVPVQVRDFVGSWQFLSPEDRTSVEEHEAFGSQLGKTAVVGDSIWDEQSRIRVKLGPLKRLRYLEFLPDGVSWRPLRALVDFFCNRETEVELQLILASEDVPECDLDEQSEQGPRLGWFTWIKSQPEFDRSPEDTILLLM